MFSTGTVKAGSLAGVRPGSKHLRGRTVGTLLCLADALTLLICLHLAGQLFEVGTGSDGSELDSLQSSWWLQGQPVWIPLLAVLLLVWLAARRHHVERPPFLIVARDVALGVGVATMVDGWLEHVAGMSATTPWHGYRWVLVGACLLVERGLVQAILQRIGAWRRSTLIIGNRQACRRLRRFLKHNSHLACTVEADIAVDEPAAWQGSDLTSVIAADRLDFAIISSASLDQASLTSITALLDEAGVDYSLAWEFDGVKIFTPGLRRGLGHDVLLLERGWPPGGERFRSVAKRTFDVAAAGAALILLAPLMLLIAMIIRLDGGPAVFASARVGRNGQIFPCLKFRSMVPDSETVLSSMLAGDPRLRAEWEAHFKLRDDPRITRIGRFLRRSSLDELPQLFNVLHGDMSMVGPRPLLPDEVDAYGPAIAPYYRYRPGITGLWQVSGRDDLDYEDRIELNTWYLNNWSLSMDMLILLRTIRVIWQRNGAS